MAVSTTLKLPIKLKARIAKLAKESGQSAHHLMVDGLERYVERTERMHAFVDEASKSARELDSGGEVYAADEVHDWMGRLADGKKTARPKPWRR